MKINKIFLPVLPVLFLFLFVSCTSVQNYGQSTDSFKVLYSGEIKKFKKSGTYTESDIVVNDIDKSGIGFERLISGSVTYMKMDGTISLSDSVYTLKISYKQEFDDKDSIHSVRNIVIEGLPAMYQFAKFDISGTAVSIKKYIHEKDMPVVLADFSVGGKEFSVLLTVMNVIPSRSNNICTSMDLVSLKEQVFQIADKNGTIYAEFTYDYYKIFSVPDSKMDEKLLWPCIAAFSTLRNIVLNVN